MPNALPVTFMFGVIKLFGKMSRRKRNLVCGIYRISSVVHPDRIYIGSSVDYIERVRKHLNKLKIGKHNNPKLQAHYNKYGVDDMIFELIEEIQFTTLDYLLEREQHYLDTLKPYLNVCMIAGSSLGVKRSDEAKRKIGDASKGHKMPDHVLKLLVEINTGSHISEEHKKAISVAQSKPKPWLSERNKGNTYGKANKGNPSPFKGKKKKKTGVVPKSAFLKGHEPWNKGKNVSYIPHPNQSESMKAYWKRRKEKENGEKEKI